MSDRKIFYDKQQFILSIIGLFLGFFFVSGCLGSQKYIEYKC